MQIVCFSFQKKKFVWFYLEFQPFGNISCDAVSITFYSSFTTYVAYYFLIQFLFFIYFSLLTSLNLYHCHFPTGLDIAKHGEPAYPQASYGDGWGVEPERTVGQTGLVLQTNCAADASSNIETVSKSNIEIVS